ncbi:MAG: hypothetical protein R2690_02915 [Acidimicrobiales bacterium]
MASSIAGELGRPRAASSALIAVDPPDPASAPPPPNLPPPPVGAPTPAPGSLPPPPGPLPPPPIRPLVPRGPDGTPVRPLSLQDLPPAIAAKLQFDAAAPKRLRTADLPAPVAEELRQLWDGIVADVYDQVAGVSRRKALGRDQVQQVLQRVASRVVHAERVLIVAAVHAPVPASAEWKHVAMAGAGGAGAAFAEELAVLGSAGTAVTVAIVAAVAGEVLETYVAASARTVQYERPPVAGRRHRGDGSGRGRRLRQLGQPAPTCGWCARPPTGWANS